MTGRAAALWTTLLAVVTLAAAPGAARAQSKELPLVEGRHTLTVQGERYGALRDDHPMVVRSREIFERIVRAAGRRPGLALELHVLDTPRIIAESLRGGIVVVSRGFVDLARSDENALAFVFAHEIAHLQRDHHALLDSLGILGASVASGGSRAARPDVVSTYQAFELDADRLGVLFSALAGYRVAAAIPILMLLTERAGPDPFHPNPKERAAVIRDQLGEIRDHLEVFHGGLYLVAIGRYREGAQVLEHFLSLFPSREVMSAVGVAYHKEALRYVPAPEFRHLLVIDAATRAASRGVGTPPAFRQFMDRAVHYYTLAADADPTYAPAHSNLAAAYLDLGERELAIGHATRAIRADPRLASAYNNRALAALQGKDVRRAEDDLLTAARLEPGLRVVAQNLARMYEYQGRADDAQRWAARVPADAASRGTAPDMSPEFAGGIMAGMPVTRLADWMSEPGVRQLKIPLASGAPDLTLSVFNTRGIAVLSRGGQIDAVALLPGSRDATGQGIRPGEPAARVEAVYGRPSGQEATQWINVWGYPGRGLALFVVRDRVQSIWAGLPARAGR